MYLISVSLFLIGFIIGFITALIYSFWFLGTKFYKKVEKGKKFQNRMLHQWILLGWGIIPMIISFFIIELVFSPFLINSGSIGSILLGMFIGVGVGIISAFKLEKK